MRILRAKRGGRADTFDRIYINRLPDGRASWNGAIDIGGATLFGNSRSALASIQDAEAEAIKWAQANGAMEIMIEGADP